MQLAHVGKRHTIALHRIAWRSVGLGKVQQVTADVDVKPFVSLQEVRGLRFRVLLTW